MEKCKKHIPRPSKLKTPLFSIQRCLSLIENLMFSYLWLKNWNAVRQCWVQVVNKAPLLPKPACLYAIISLHPTVCFILPPHVGRGEGIPSGNDPCNPCPSERSHPSISKQCHVDHPLLSPIQVPLLHCYIHKSGFELGFMEDDPLHPWKVLFSFFKTTSKQHQQHETQCKEPVNAITM